MIFPSTSTRSKARQTILKGFCAAAFVGLIISLATHPTLVAARPNEKWDELTSQAGALYQAGKFSEALEPAKQALQLAEAQKGNNPAQYATSLNNLALLYNSMGDYTRAEPLYEEALSIVEKVLGKDHPSYATSLNNLAHLYVQMGDYTRAEPLYEEALAIVEKALGKEHPDTLTSLNNMAAFYYEQERLNEALELMKQAVEGRRKVLGEDHPNTQGSISWLEDIRAAQAKSDADPDAEE